MTSGSDGAFPAPPYRIDYPMRTEHVRPEKGVTKREYLASYLLVQIYAQHPRMKAERAAELAVERADALLRALTLHQSLLADLMAKDHPEPEEFFRVAEALEEIGKQALFQKFDYPEAAEKMRQRMGEKA